MVKLLAKNFTELNAVALANNWDCEAINCQKPASYAHSRLNFDEAGYFSPTNRIEGPKFLCMGCYLKLIPKKEQMVVKERKKGAGGARIGAGRKKLPANQKCIEAAYYIPPILKPKLDAYVRELKENFKVKKD